MRYMPLSAVVTFVLSASLLPAQSAKPSRSLYDRLGGKPAITAVVDEFVGRVAADTRVNAFFAATVADSTRTAALKTRLVEQVCEAAGGPCRCHGKNMKAAHAGMQISNADFDALVEDLVGALDKFKVAEADKAELLRILGGLKADIVSANKR
jgi:hemoglobin